MCDMYGKPKDTPGECNAHLYIADDWGDNTATIRCQLEKGHSGLHRESFRREGKVIIEWEVDERSLDENEDDWKFAEDC